MSVLIADASIFSYAVAGRNVWVFSSSLETSAACIVFIYKVYRIGMMRYTDTMEQWLLYAIASAIFSGLHAFTLKIAAERGISSGYFNAYSCSFSAFIGALIAYVYVPLQGAWILGIVMAFLSGAVYVCSSGTRIESLRYITSSLYFPISKSTTVIFTTIAGVLLFNEVISIPEWVGLFLALLVPLTLFHADEIPLQKNIYWGVIFLIAASLFSTVATIINKYSTGIFEAPLLFVVLTHISIALVGWGSGSIEEKKRNRENKEVRHRTLTMPFVVLCVCAGSFQLLGFWTNIVSLTQGPLSLAYAVMSFQMLVPMLLSAWIYHEHWDIRKYVALALSCASMYFLV
jgi:drug/metabolite transporter (DMT)-like permease